MRRLVFYVGMIALAAVIELALLYTGETLYGETNVVAGAHR